MLLINKLYRYFRSGDAFIYCAATTQYQSQSNALSVQRERLKPPQAHPILSLPADLSILVLDIAYSFLITGKFPCTCDRG